MRIQNASSTREISVAVKKQHRIKYDGEWKDGKKRGRGCHTWVNGSKYDGEWKKERGGSVEVTRGSTEVNMMANGKTARSGADDFGSPSTVDQCVHLPQVKGHRTLLKRKVYIRKF